MEDHLKGKSLQWFLFSSIVADMLGGKDYTQKEMCHNNWISIFIFSLKAQKGNDNFWVFYSGYKFTKQIKGGCAYVYTKWN